MKMLKNIFFAKVWMNWLLFRRKKCLIIFGQNFEIQMTVDSESAVAHCLHSSCFHWLSRKTWLLLRSEKKVVSNSNNLLQRFEKCCQNLAKNPLIMVRVIYVLLSFIFRPKNSSLKVSYFQKDFLLSSILPKNEQKNSNYY